MPGGHDRDTQRYCTTVVYNNNITRGGRSGSSGNGGDGGDHGSAVVPVAFVARLALAAVRAHLVHANGVRVASVHPVLTLVDVHAPGLQTVQRAESRSHTIL